MLFPRRPAISNAVHCSSSPPASSSSSSSPFPSLRLPSPPNPPDNLFILAALSLLSLFRHPSPLPHLPFPPKPTRVTTMRGGGRPPPLTTTSNASTGRGAAAKSLAFSTPESLSDWLRHRLPSDSFASWGVKPGTKTVHNLWLELSQGETSLLQEDPLHYQPSETDPPTPTAPLPEQEESQNHLLLRTVHVATVRIRNSSGKFLVESHQLLSDGTIRRRHRPLSEKMKPGEMVEDATTRAVLEELGARNVRILPGSYEMRVEDKASVSYPGLPARYILHSVGAEVDGLPEEGEFSTEETGEGSDEQGGVEKAIFVKMHFWKWVQDYECGSDDASSLPAV